MMANLNPYESPACIVEDVVTDTTWWYKAIGWPLWLLGFIGNVFGAMPMCVLAIIIVCNHVNSFGLTLRDVVELTTLVLCLCALFACLYGSIKCLHWLWNING